MKVSYGVSNLRNIKDMPTIELKPITILVGRNSAGKSTFLRSFPLLRQSLEVRSSAPVLWFGDRVDYGNFETAVYRGEDSGDICFKFNIKDYKPTNIHSPFFNFSERYYYTKQSIHIESADVKINIGQHKNKTIRRKISVSLPFEEVHMEIIFSNDGCLVSKITINNIDVTEILDNYNVIFPRSYIFDTPLLIQKDLLSEGKRAQSSRIYAEKILYNVTENILRSYVHKRLSKENLLVEINRIFQVSRLNKKNIERLMRGAQTKTFEKLYKSWINNKNEELLEKVTVISAFRQLLYIISVLFDMLSMLFNNINYLGPARARGERFYRYQELAVSEIASDGQNLPMFLASLKTHEIESFSNWVEGLFGYGIGVSRLEGHISINRIKSGFKVNVADTGYGVSQLLPVLAQIWWSSNKGRATRSQLIPSEIDFNAIAIEQPELHLHPAHQAKLAEVFAEAVRKSNGDKNGASIEQFIVETHSEALINRLGELIQDGKLSENMVQIVVFGGEHLDDDTSTAAIATFNKDGTLENWPYGFFNY